MLFLVSFLTMLNLKLHSCVDLAHVYGYSSDCGSFRDCVVSHCVQLCSFVVFLFLFSLFVLHSLRILVLKTSAVGMALHVAAHVRQGKPRINVIVAAN